MIHYRDIEGLPADHPKVKRFEAQEALLDRCYAECARMGASASVIDPEAILAEALAEGDLDYFNRYVAGDR